MTSLKAKTLLTLECVIYRFEVKYAHLNLKVIDIKYVNSTTPIKVKCLICGNEFCYYIGNLFQEQGCGKCAALIRGQNQRKSFDETKIEVAKYNFTLLNIEYDGTQLLEVECSQFHKSKKTLYHIKRGDTCPDCISARNMSESICRKYFEYLFNLPFKKKTFDWLINDNGNNQELDGYNADLNLAFERDGGTTL